MTQPPPGKPASTGRVDALDYALFLPCVWIACSFGFSLGVIGPAFVIIPVLCVFYSILRLTVPPRILGVYAGLCLVAGVLSHYRVFPASWQEVFLDEAIGRQLVPVFSVFAVAWASKAYFRRRLRSEDIFAGERVILFLSFVVAPLFMLLQNVHYQEDNTITTVFAAYGAMINNIVIGLFFITGRLFYARDWSRLAAAAAVLLVATTTHFVQFWLMAMAAFAILLRAPPRVTAVAVAAFLTITYAYEMTRIPQEMAENPNKGIRVVFIVDAFTSLLDTRGLGIGYGTESVRWTYQIAGLPKFTFMPDRQTISRERLLEILSRGVHNSFAQAMLRTGALGIMLLSSAFFAAFPPRNLTTPARSHASILFLIIFIACFVNPALESPVQLVGIGFVYGYLLALRAHTVALHRERFSISRLMRFPPPGHRPVMTRRRVGSIRGTSESSSPIDRMGNAADDRAR